MKNKTAYRNVSYTYYSTLHLEIQDLGDLYLLKILLSDTSTSVDLEHSTYSGKLI